MKPSTPPGGTLVTELSHSLSSARLSLAWIMVFAAALELLIAPRRRSSGVPVGIDVSTFQGSIDWAKVKASGDTFAWARASDGMNFDNTFTNNEVNAKAAGVLIGAYHNAEFEVNFGTSGAIAEANYFWGVASNYITGGGSYLMPVLDVEGSTSGYTQTSLSQWVNQWCLTLSNNAAAAGVTIKPVIYASASFASTWFDSTVTQWTPWIAEWHPANPKPLPQSDAPASTSPWPTWTVWQYINGTPTPGITANTDQDIFNGNWSSLVTTLVIGGTTSIGPSVVGRAGFNFMDPADTGSSGGPQGFPACETMGASDSAGVVPQTGWYNLTAGGGPAYFHAAAGVSIYWETPGGGTHNLRYGITPGDAILMRGYLDTGDNTTDTAIVSSLPFQLYDVLCYSIGDNGSATRVGKFTLSATNNGVLAANSTKYIQDNGSSTFTGTYIEATSTNNFPSAVAGNYCRFYAVRGTNFAIRCTPSYGSDGHPRSPFNAIQIVQVDPTPTLSNPSYTNGQFQCFLNGATNASYTILASTDFVSWTPVSTNTAPAQITNSPPANTPYRFYRALFQ